MRALALGLGFVAAGAGAVTACSGDPTPVVPVDASSVARDTGPAPAADASVEAAADATGDRDPCASPGPSICSPAASWDAPVAVMPGKLASITPDELHLAVLANDDGGSSLRIFDRASTTETFGGGQAFGFPVDGSGASLSKDGRLLLVTFGQRPRLSSRSGPGVAFGAPETSAFQFGDEGELYRGPVMLENDAFFLTTFGASIGQPAFTVIDKVGSVYRQATFLYPQPELENTSDGGAAVKSPTGMSKDLRTLFFYDEEKKVTKAAFRPAPGCPYTTFVDLGDRPFAMPNGACTAIYYDDPALGVARMARKP